MKVYYEADTGFIRAHGTEPDPIPSGCILAEIPDNEDLANYKVISGILTYSLDLVRDNLNNNFKRNARYKIAVEVGDEQDLIADLSKRIALIERAFMRLLRQVLSGTPMAEENSLRYLTFAEAYTDAVDAGYFVDRADLEDENELFTRLMQRMNIISNTVKEEYFDKLIAKLDNIETTPIIYSGIGVNLTNDLTISDVFRLKGAQISISGYIENEDNINFINTSTISGLFENGNLILSGDDYSTAYQNIIRNITYNNIAETPTSGSRIFEIYVNTLNSSNILTREIII